MSQRYKRFKPSVKIPKLILFTAKIIQSVSLYWATLFAARLFSTPIRYKTPKRELEMRENSRKKMIEIPSVSKKIMVYEYGKSDKKILLVHGWSGRGTQLVKIADAFLRKGYQTISFDAPAHGDSEGKSTLMPEFIDSILHLEKIYGKFEGVVGHSLGGMSVINSVKDGLNTKKAVIIGSGDVVQDILDDFVSQMKLKHQMSIRLKNYFEKKSKQKMNSLSTYLSAQKIDIPVLVIHDENDGDVPVECAFHIHKHLKKGSIYITEGLGHRKILGDSKVIRKTIEFITDTEYENDNSVNTSDIHLQL